MSGGLTDPLECGVCGKEAYGVENGISLCGPHAAVASRLGKLRATRVDPTVDLTGLRSNGPRDSHKGGYERPFDVVPDDSLEQVYRDVTVSVEDVPFWGVETLFHHIHDEMGKADLDGWSATLVIQYSSLSEHKYAKLISLRDLLWMDFNIETTEVRLYPPRKAESTDK